MQGTVAASVRVGDEVCREWLAWRGFAGALRALDADAAGVAGLPLERLAELVLGATASSLAPALFAPFLVPSLVALSGAVERPPTGTRGEPEDNAVTALGKIIIHQYTPAPPGAPAPRAE